MARYVALRLLQSIPVFVLASVIIFAFLRMTPGDPAILMAGPDATPQQLEALTRQYGLDQPITVQYITWLGNLARGDLGKAFISQRSVADIILGRLPATIHLAFGTMIVMTVFGFPLGIFAAIRPNNVLSRLVTLFNALALALPTFWVGILFLLFFAVRLHWLPASGFVSFAEDPVRCVRHLILPSFTMGLAGIAVIVRFLNSSITEIVGSDFIRTAHAKGLAERVVISRHVLKIAMLPVVTVLAIQFGHLLGGAVVTEAVFGLPGVGRLMIDAIMNQEYLIVQATMLMFVGVYVVLNTTADIIVGLLDPRIRL